MEGDIPRVAMILDMVVELTVGIRELDMFHTAVVIPHQLHILSFNR
jgi:hypothetical protein